MAGIYQIIDVLPCVQAFWAECLSFRLYCRQQANKYGIKGSRVAAAQNTVYLLDDMIDYYVADDKLTNRWCEIEAYAADGRDHVQIVTGKHPDGREVRTFQVCGRMVQEYVNLKEARKVCQLILDSYGTRALEAEQNQGVDWKALCYAVRVHQEAQ